MENKYYDASVLKAASGYPAMFQYEYPGVGNTVTVTFVSQDQHCAWLNNYLAEHKTHPVFPYDYNAEPSTPESPIEDTEITTEEVAVIDEATEAIHEELANEEVEEEYVDEYSDYEGEGDEEVEEEDNYTDSMLIEE